MAKYKDIFNWYFKDPTEFTIRNCKRVLADYVQGKHRYDVYVETYQAILPALINQQGTIRQALTFFTPLEQKIIGEAYGKTTKEPRNEKELAPEFNLAPHEIRNILDRFTKRYKKLGGNSQTHAELFKPIHDALG